MSGTTILEPGQIEAAANIPPFILLPPADLFARRAERLRQLAEGHPLGDYLRLIARLCDAQQRLLDTPPRLPSPDPDALARSLEHGMPPLAYDGPVREDAWLGLLDQLLDELEPGASPAVADALARLRQADPGQRKAWAIALLSGQFDLLPAALVPFLGAALQVAFSHLLLALPQGLLVESESQTLCPACGSPPVAGVIHHRGKHNGLRYLACSLCSCQWHYVRVKCSYCQESKQLAYLSLERDDRAAEQAPLRAEACPNCQGYLKQFYREHAPEAEAQADDLASLALDLLLAEEGYLRRAPNLLLAPGGED
ncbi:formate dehydrogenase accessory protein FdhE [Zestomonas carbonaria]|uniref:Protein FdhE homolog n=1 Tax=Zestomonas carbonaria TaxID=2762745 RepID=A0A7U7EN18_9GAMM|nr:formate dehydrogenase accessory protein FdhE [Pseudomonas carbonaria]CAD5107653.1 Protein FdhE [Pseudomonas carbonaria]